MDAARSDQAQLRAAAGGGAEALSERFSCLFDGVAQLVLPLLSLEERARAACARKAWRVAAATPALLTELNFARCAAQVTDDALKTLCAHAGAELRTLRFDTCMKVTGEGVIAALHDGGCAGVRCIDAPNAIFSRLWLSPALVVKLVAACPKLEHTACVVRSESLTAGVQAATMLPGPLNLYYSSRWDVSTVNDPLLYDGLLPRSVTSLNLYTDLRISRWLRFAMHCV